MHSVIQNCKSQSAVSVMKVIINNASSIAGNYKEN